MVAVEIIAGKGVARSGRALSSNGLGIDVLYVRIEGHQKKSRCTSAQIPESNASPLGMPELCIVIISARLLNKIVKRSKKKKYLTETGPFLSSQI